MLRLVNALETPTTGSVEIDGRDITRLRERDLRALRSDIGMIFQQFNLFDSRNVAGNVAYPLEVAGRSRSEIASRVEELLRFVGLADKARSYPEQLSGGQKQRVGIARALATNPRILLADEATSALDPDTTQEVLELLERVNRELGITILVITHEMDVIRTLAGPRHRHGERAHHRVRRRVRGALGPAARRDEAVRRRASSRTSRRASSCRSCATAIPAGS